MIKVLGAVLVWGGCGLWGLHMAAGMRRTVALLEMLGQALEEMERELFLNRTALPELLERISKSGSGQGRELFACCREMLEKGKGFTYAWEKALEKSALKREERVLLNGLGQLLGQYDAREQSRGLTHLRQELERRTARRRDEVRALGRVYSVLGVTAGGFLTLALL